MLFQELKQVLLGACIALISFLRIDNTLAQAYMPLVNSRGLNWLQGDDSLYHFERNGNKLFYRKWSSPQTSEKTKAILVLHGIGFHGYPYKKIMQYIDNDSILVYAMDLSGNGLSGNSRGTMESDEENLVDIDSMICIIKKENPGIKTYLMGVSMGGIYAVAYAIHDSIFSNLSGMILVGPAIRIHSSQIFNLGNISLIYFYLFNRHKPVFYLDGKRLETSTRDQKYINTRRNDTLSIHYVSLDYMAKVHKVQKECKKKSLLERISVPTLIIHGGEDRISSIKGSNFLARNLPAEKTHLVVYPGCRHSVFWDTDSVRAVRDLVNWISKN